MLKVIANNDHVAHSNASRKEHRPDRIDQSGIPYNQICWHQSAAEIHCNNEKDAEKFSSRQIPDTQRICGQIDHNHRENRSDHRILDTVQEAGDNAAVREHRLVAIERESAREQECLSRINIIRIGNRSNQHIIERICNQKHDNETEYYQDDITRPVGHAMKPSCLFAFSHTAPPIQNLLRLKSYWLSYSQQSAGSHLRLY